MNIFALGLISTECICGNEKLKRNSFCYECWRTLPVKLQSKLYRKMGNGYEEAFISSIERLLKNKRVSYTFPRFIFFLEKLIVLVNKHRAEEFLICPESCWCWGADIFANNNMEALNVYTTNS